MTLAKIALLTLSMSITSVYAYNPPSDGGGSKFPGFKHYGAHYKGCGHTNPGEGEETAAVPEIDAGSIGLAVALIGGLLVYIRERRKI